MPARPDGGARDRVLIAAMDLFGRQGFRATTVAQIEEAAGLSPGAGGLYRHFVSKRQLLEEGLRRQVEGGPEVLAAAGGAPAPDHSLEAQLLAVARAGLRRLEQERDLNRLLLRDLATFPDLLAQVRDRELRTVHQTLLAWLRTQTDDRVRDPAALAAVLMGAVSHYWIMADVFDGEHPLEIGEERYLGALAAMAARALGADP